MIKKLTVYKESCKKEEREIQLELVQAHNGVQVVAVYKDNGDSVGSGNVLTITHKGEVQLHRGMNTKIGLGSRLTLEIDE